MPRRTRITPLARRKAKDLGVNLAELTPGQTGKIGGADVERFAAARAASMGAPAGGVAARRVSLSNLRRIVGKRMTASSQNVPQFSVSTEADAARLLDFKAALKESGRDVSLTALLVRLTATALQAHPMVNAQFHGDEALVFETVNMAVAVAAPDGLRVPVIHGAEKLSLLGTAARLDELTRLARSGSLATRAVEGGTFTLSNLGMFGVTQFTPLINPPQAAILGVGAARSVLVPGPDGRALSVKLMTLTLTADHRLLDGADAAAFLATLKGEIERCLILRVE
jgi:pyruvate dehydrogenase E2 component (dihydrolipoamide acetyltransferase)